MRSRSLLSTRSLGLAAALWISPLLACARAPEPPGDLIVITLDTLRADHLGCYGYFRDTSPELDRFAAEEAVLFEQLHVPMATTLPAHTSLFTGLEPLEHGVLANLNHGGLPFAPRPGARTLAEMAAEAGYTTAAFVSSTPLKPFCGLAAGFDVYDSPEEHLRRGEETVDRALAWLAETEGRPRVLWTHLFDPHYPWRAPAEHRLFRVDDELRTWLADREFVASVGIQGLQGKLRDTTWLANQYDAEVHYTDAQVGRLLEALRSSPRWEATTVVVIADHGEGLGQHGEGAHGGVYAEQLQVPCLLRLPGSAGRALAGTRTDVLGGMVDVLPTVLPRWDRAVAAEFVVQGGGRDLLAPPSTRPTEPRLLSRRTARVLPENDPGPLWALTTESWRYHHRPEQGDLLFARDTDPFELRNLLTAEPELAGDLLEHLLAERAEQLARGAALGEGASLEAVDEATRRELEALGYGGADD